MRLDISFENCQLGNCAKPTVKDLIRANKAVSKLKSNELCVVFDSFADLGNISVVCFSDASFGNLVS